MDTLHITMALSPLGLGEVVGVAEMSGGTSPAYRVELAERQAVVLRIYPDFPAKTPRKDAYASRQLEALGVPITRFLLIDETRSRLPFRFAVTNYLPGVPVGSLRQHPDVGNLYGETGALLRKLHAVSMPGYGPFNAEGLVGPVSSNTVFIRGLIEHAFGQFATQGASGALADRLRIMLEDGFEAVVPYSRGAVFAHDDLHPNNVLALEAPNGKLTLSGLIDFGNARAADPIFDLAKCLFCSEHEAPGCTPYILDGYGPLDHPHAAAVTTTRCCIGL
jgi:aminoglycoside phosphotransferase (APT) family kinase protein